MKKTSLLLCLTLLLVSNALALSGSSLPAGQQKADLAALKLYFGGVHGDNFTTATSEGERDAKNSGYRYARIECFIFRTQVAGTVPLKLYYSDQRNDNYTTATETGERNAKAAGYRYVRIEGYIFAKEEPYTVPLKLYYSDARGDNFTTASAEGERDAKLAGYRYAGIEGYVIPATVDIGAGDDVVVAPPAAGTSLNLTGAWTVVIQSTGDPLQGDWTRTDRWEFTPAGEGTWRVKITILNSRVDKEGEMPSGGSVGRTFEDTYRTVNDGNGRFRLVTPDGRGSAIEMPGTFTQNEFSVRYSSKGINYSYNGRR